MAATNWDGMLLTVTRRLHTIAEDSPEWAGAAAEFAAACPSAPVGWLDGLRGNPVIPAAAVHAVFEACQSAALHNCVSRQKCSTIRLGVFD